MGVWVTVIVGMGCCWGRGSMTVGGAPIVLLVLLLLIVPHLSVLACRHATTSRERRDPIQPNPMQSGPALPRPGGSDPIQILTLRVCPPTHPETIPRRCCGRGEPHTPKRGSHHDHDNTLSFFAIASS